MKTIYEATWFPIPIGQLIGILFFLFVLWFLLSSLPENFFKLSTDTIFKVGKTLVLLVCSALCIAVVYGCCKDVCACAIKQYKYSTNDYDVVSGYAENIHINENGRTSLGNVSFSLQGVEVISESTRLKGYCYIHDKYIDEIQNNYLEVGYSEVFGETVIVSIKYQENSSPTKK